MKHVTTGTKNVNVNVDKVKVCVIVKTAPRVETRNIKPTHVQMEVIFFNKTHNKNIKYHRVSKVL